MIHSIPNLILALLVCSSRIKAQNGYKYDKPEIANQRLEGQQERHNRDPQFIGPTGKLQGNFYPGISSKVLPGVGSQPSSDSEYRVTNQINGQNNYQNSGTQIPSQQDRFPLQTSFGSQPSKEIKGQYPTISLQGSSGNYDDNANEGDYSAIPGEPGKDYPVYSEIPETSFKCSEQQYPGYYADVEAQCQVFHICANNKVYDFLCPNGTVFHQEYLVCVWWNQFECNIAPSLYGINANLYDYSKTGAGAYAGYTEIQNNSRVDPQIGYTEASGNPTTPQQYYNPQKPSGLSPSYQNLRRNDILGSEYPQESELEHDYSNQTPQNVQPNNFEHSPRLPTSIDFPRTPNVADKFLGLRTISDTPKQTPENINANDNVENRGYPRTNGSPTPITFQNVNNRGASEDLGHSFNNQINPKIANSISDFFGFRNRQAQIPQEPLNDVENQGYPRSTNGNNLYVAPGDAQRPGNNFRNNQDEPQGYSKTPSDNNKFFGQQFLNDNGNQGYLKKQNGNGKSLDLENRRNTNETPGYPKAQTGNDESAKQSPPNRLENRGYPRTNGSPTPFTFQNVNNRAASEDFGHSSFNNPINTEIANSISDFFGLRNRQAQIPQEPLNDVQNQGYPRGTNGNNLYVAPANINSGVTQRPGNTLNNNQAEDSTTPSDNNKFFAQKFLNDNGNQGYLKKQNGNGKSLDLENRRNTNENPGYPNAQNGNEKNAKKPNNPLENRGYPRQPSSTGITNANQNPRQKGFPTTPSNINTGEPQTRPSNFGSEGYPANFGAGGYPNPEPLIYSQQNNGLTTRTSIAGGPENQHNPPRGYLPPVNG